jgi:hypothetical protein
VKIIFSAKSKVIINVVPFPRFFFYFYKIGFCVCSSYLHRQHSVSLLYTFLQLDDGPFCIAVFDFAGERAEDLSFLVGDKIVLLAHVNSEWLRGSVHGREGIFPAAFVNIVKDLTGASYNNDFHAV